MENKYKKYKNKYKAAKNQIGGAHMADGTKTVRLGHGMTDILSTISQQLFDNTTKVPITEALNKYYDKNDDGTTNKWPVIPMKLNEKNYNLNAIWKIITDNNKYYLPYQIERESHEQHLTASKFFIYTDDERKTIERLLLILKQYLIEFNSYTDTEIFLKLGGNMDIDGLLNNIKGSILSQASHYDTYDINNIELPANTKRRKNKLFMAMNKVCKIVEKASSTTSDRGQAVEASFTSLLPHTTSAPPTTSAPLGVSKLTNQITDYIYSKTILPTDINTQLLFKVSDHPRHKYQQTLRTNQLTKLTVFKCILNVICIITSMIHNIINTYNRVNYAHICSVFHAEDISIINHRYNRPIWSPNRNWTTCPNWSTMTNVDKNSMIFEAINEHIDKYSNIMSQDIYKPFYTNDINLREIIETINRLIPVLNNTIDEYVFCNSNEFYNNIIIDRSIYLMNCITTLVNQLERLERSGYINIDSLLTDSTIDYRTKSRIELFIDAGITAMLEYFS